MRRQCCYCGPKDKQLEFIKENAALVDEAKVPPVDQYLDGDGEKATWSEEEIKEAQAQVKEWEAEAAEAAAKASTMASVNQGVTRTVSSVGSFFAGMGGAAVSVVAGRKVDEPTDAANDSGGKKELV